MEPCCSRDVTIQRIRHDRVDYIDSKTERTPTNKYREADNQAAHGASLFSRLTWEADSRIE